ncbi:hypothetical protein [Bacillus sp. FJAT-27225]|uniref:hypothetical protein n=1 Tax=Bacillus sp. FJAT-27225 TaxID=1743144 RepID=UPI0020C807CF|nr:hypothetical protein [Bacillus sp. FJAT-27225]
MFDVIDMNESLLQEEIRIKGPYFYGKVIRNSIKKFTRDKVFCSKGNKCFVLDGVILNKHELFKKYDIQDDSMVSLLETMSFTNPETFYKEFRGTFAGLSIVNNSLYLFTNHIGDKDVFYYMDEDKTLFFATDFEALIKIINRVNGKKFKINKNAAYSLLTHSHVLCNETLFQDVYRLTPGHYLSYSKEIKKIENYFTLNNNPKSISEKEATRKIDLLFKKAVKLAFDKDLEYGYKHLVALSGGLDSRMTTWVAYDLGYKNMLNYTFSQSDYLDQTIPKQITNRLRTEWLFKALDNGTYLYKYFKDSIKISGARSQSSTIAHTLSMVSNINLDKYGLIHTGQLGDVIIGTFYDNGKKSAFTPGAGAYSTKLIDKVDYSIKNAFHIEDMEIFKFYNRGFTGVNTGLKPMYQYTETISPFLDIDFLEFCLSLPLEFRSGHKIYIKWINEYYPDAANFVYEKVKGKINRRTITVKGIPVPWTSIPGAAIKLIRNKLGLKLSTKNHMHPTDYWYKTNPELKKFYHDFYNNNINLITNIELKADCRLLFEGGTASEKDQVITLLGFVNLFDSYIKENI